MLKKNIHKHISISQILLSTTTTNMHIKPKEINRRE